jgi:putative acetyltransferase
VSVSVEPVPTPTFEARKLLAELDRFLGAMYEPDRRHALSIEQLLQPHIRFFIARLNREAVGCGGVALYSDYAEVKRVYTREAARGRGVGATLLAHIEVEAREAGKWSLRLETGIHQVAAIGLYQRCGFRQRGAFGHYADLPPHSIATSVFYEKSL